MIKKYIIMFFSVLILLTGCGPKEIAEEQAGGCSPEKIQVNVNDGSMEVRWNNSCENLISGYNIYINEKPNSVNDPHNNGPYAGDTNPDDGVETYQADHLENGKIYYVSVKIINTDQSLSQPSKEIPAVCGPRTEIDLSVRFKSDHDGYSFDKNEFVRADNVDNDLYFYSKDGKDYISSPHKLDGFLKVNKLGKISYKGDFDGLKSKIESLSSVPSKDRVEVSKGDWIHLVTSDNNNGFIKVLDLSGNGEKRVIKLFIAYSTVAGEMIF